MDSFKCKRCGKCCQWAGYVRLRDGEAEKIADFLELELHAFTAEYTRVTADRRNLSLTEKADGSCIFYEDNPPGCAINPVKPEQCRNFPQEWNFPGWRDECAGAEEL
ncbi:MAG: YkgJ family cysteine cluster protein [Victivallales bacterium]